MKVHGTQVAALLAAYLAVALRSSYGVAAAARDSDACDFGDAQMKRLCRKVESQEQYFEKMVDICETFFVFSHVAGFHSAMGWKKNFQFFSP